MRVFPAPLVVVVALVAFGAGSSGTYYVMHNKAVTKELAIYKEGRRRQELGQGKVNEYSEIISDLRERKPRVVRYCPDKVRAPSGPDAPGPAEAPERDLGPLLREAHEELIRCNKLRESAQ